MKYDWSPDVASHIWHICTKCWIDDPNERWSMSDVLKYLQDRDVTHMHTQPSARDAHGVTPPEGDHSESPTTSSDQAGQHQTILHELLASLSHLDYTESLCLEKESSLPVARGDVSDTYVTHLNMDGEMVKVAVSRTRTYKGRHVGSYAKVFKDSQNTIFQRFLTRQQMLANKMHIWSKLNHTNILKFVGYSMSKRGLPLLISVWMENGTVLDYLVQHADADILGLVSFNTARPLADF